jgi:Uma2 family endonuclease
MADLVARLGGVPLDRIRMQPPPGTARLQDVIDVLDRESVACELMEGTLVEQPVSAFSIRLGSFILMLLGIHVRAQNLGVVTGEHGTYELRAGVVRIPDVAFTSWGRMPGRQFPNGPLIRLVPDLVVEVLSPSNTAGEMTLKRDDYFTTGVRLVWEVDPDNRVVTVYTSPTQSRLLAVGDVLDGSPVLPGFTLPLAELFGELDRHG